MLLLYPYYRISETLLDICFSKLQTRITLTVREVKLPPQLLFFEQINHGEEEKDPSLAMHTGNVDVLREGNVTNNDVGFLFLCDLNKDEELTLMLAPQDGGPNDDVTIMIQEVDVEPTASGVSKGMMGDCFDHNLR